MAEKSGGTVAGTSTAPPLPDLSEALPPLEPELGEGEELAP
jgi:hypothetical protein